MTERERLIELLCIYESENSSCQEYCSLPDSHCCDKCNHLADYLLENGVIVPPCEIKDTICAITKDEFMQELSRELNQGFSSTDCAAVLCTAASNEETYNLDLTAHFNGTYSHVSSIMEFLVKQYLAPLDDDLAKTASNNLIKVITEEQKRYQTQEGEVEHDEE